MNVITTLFVHNLCLFVNKAFDIVSIHMKFNAKSKEKAHLILLIELPRYFKYQINCLMNVP